MSGDHSRLFSCPLMVFSLYFKQTLRCCCNGSSVSWMGSPSYLFFSAWKSVCPSWLLCNISNIIFILSSISSSSISMADCDVTSLCLHADVSSLIQTPVFSALSSVCSRCSSGCQDGSLLSLREKGWKATYFTVCRKWRKHFEIQFRHEAGDEANSESVSLDVICPGCLSLLSRQQEKEHALIRSRSTGQYWGLRNLRVCYVYLNSI